jgi:hypothetical protein
MTHILKSTIIFFIVFVGSDAQSRPSKKQLQNANYGEPIEQSHCEKLVENFYRPNLKDPYSARFTDFGVCKKHVSYFAIREASKGFYVAGYMISFSVNAKNSFGGYTGATPFIAFLRENQILAVSRGDCSANHFGYTFCYGAESVFDADKKAFIQARDASLL